MAATNIGEFPDALKGLVPADKETALAFFQNIIDQVLTNKFYLEKLTSDVLQLQAAREALDEVVRKTGEDRQDAIMKALTLYSVVIDALKEGNRLVLVTDDYHFVREIQGLLESKKEANPSEALSGAGS